MIYNLYLIYKLKAETSDPLTCYSCNSNYQKCSFENFDKGIHRSTYCYGRCIKMNIYPGDFTIRTCSTFLDNSIIWSNSTKKVSSFSSQQCYISNIYDQKSSSIKQSYICICSDRQGCNHTISYLRETNINYAFIAIILLLVLI